jgi:hypothetical protein
MKSESTIVTSKEQFTILCFHLLANRIRKYAKEKEWSVAHTIQNLIIKGFEKIEEEERPQ